MIGALIGDIVGSAYEFRRYNVKSKDFALVGPRTRFTDDSALTIAVCEAVLKNYPFEDLSKLTMIDLSRDAVESIVKWHDKYPDVGYGGRFRQWCARGDRKPYYSLGNGSGMRISSVGWLCNSEREIKAVSAAVTKVTHSHPEGIKGAEAIAMCIYLARIGKSKEEIRERMIKDYYPRIADLDYDELVKTYQFDSTAPGSVPEAIYCFLISKDFEDCLRTAISIGGDSDTIACMACGIAEAYYKSIPESIYRDVFCRYIEPNNEIMEVINEFKKHCDFSQRIK